MLKTLTFKTITFWGSRKKKIAVSNISPQMKMNVATPLISKSVKLYKLQAAPKEYGFHTNIPPKTVLLAYSG